MASLTRSTWVWVTSGSWWWTGRPGVLWFMGLQRVGHNWATELNWTELIYRLYIQEIKRRLLLRKKAMTNLDNVLKSKHITLPIKVYIVKAMIFPVVMYECDILWATREGLWMWQLDHKEGWVPPKNWCFQTMVLEKTLESPLDSKEIKLVNPKGN